MAKKSLQQPAAKPRMVRGIDYLVRGLDPIPDDWEFASAHDALRGLCRSMTTLERLALAAEKSRDRALARDLRRVQTACSRARDNITGGFECGHIEPIVGEITRLRAQAEVQAHV